MAPTNPDRLAAYRDGFVWDEGDGVVSVRCPALNAAAVVFGTGATREEATADFEGAFETLAAYLREVGEELPPPRPR